MRKEMGHNIPIEFNIYIATNRICQYVQTYSIMYNMMHCLRLKSNLLNLQIVFFVVVVSFSF